MSTFTSKIEEWLNSDNSNKENITKLTDTSEKKELDTSKQENIYLNSLSSYLNRSNTRLGKGVNDNLNIKKFQTNNKQVNNDHNNNKSQVNQTPRFEMDRLFISWLNEQKSSLVISCYKTNHLLSIGTELDPRDNNIKSSLYLTNFKRPMGVHTTKDRIWVASSGNLWSYENYGSEIDNENFGKFDASYISRYAYFSNDVDAHDICVDDEGNPYYCSALFSCVCMPSQTHSFKVFWKPPWISKVVPEDRCHLNGICSRDGKPRYVTAVCQGNVKGSWRENRINKGVIYDIVEDKLVCTGLTMPHSPRWAYDKLWVLDAGTGYFGYVDFETKQLVRKVWIPGYLRGMSFLNEKYAVVGSSDDRYENCFQNLPLGDKLKENNISAQCGVHVIDLDNYSIPHNIKFFSPMDEIYDVCTLPNVRRPKIVPAFDEKNMTSYKIDHGNYRDEDIF